MTRTKSELILKRPQVAQEASAALDERFLATDTQTTKPNEPGRG